MDNVSLKLTVYFEEPFWVGVFERNISNQLSACEVIFGTEPKDNEIFDFILNKYCKLKYSPEILNEKLPREKLNPKRVQRDVRNQLTSSGIGTKSQQALKLQQEQNKIMRKIMLKEQKELEKEKRYALRQEKKREKHKGR